MVRKLRVQYPGAVYHVMSRGDRREDSFEDDRDVSMGQRVGSYLFTKHLVSAMFNGRPRRPDDRRRPPPLLDSPAPVLSGRSVFQKPGTRPRPSQKTRAPFGVSVIEPLPQDRNMAAACQRMSTEQSRPRSLVQTPQSLATSTRRAAGVVASLLRRRFARRPAAADLLHRLLRNHFSHP